MEYPEGWLEVPVDWWKVIHTVEPPKHVDCRCSLPERPVAEAILALAEAIHDTGDKIVICQTAYTDTDFGRIKLALAFEKRPGIVLRALVEGWSQQRIVREMY